MKGAVVKNKNRLKGKRIFIEHDLTVDIVGKNREAE